MPSGQTEAQDVTLIQQAYAGYDRQQWKITQTTDYNYLIKPKSAEGLSVNYVMAAGDYDFIDSHDATIQQRAYTSDADYGDIWHMALSSALKKGHIASTTFSLQCIGGNATGNTWHPRIVAAVNSWNNSDADTNISLTTESSDFTCTVDNYPETWYGRTTSNYNGTTITSAYIQINASTLPDSANYCQSTIAHEIGHILGLLDNPAVSNVNDSLMCHNRNREIIYSPQAFDEYNIKFLFNLI